MSATADENVGKQIGIYDVLGVCDHRSNDGHKLYHVKCSICGWENDMRLSDVKYAKQCSHLSIDGGYRAQYSWKDQRLRMIFNGMKKRCYQMNSQDYRWYGAKGIRICSEWLKNPGLFEEWAMNNGYESNLTIDRKNEDDNYCPENCRWITQDENSKYKSTTSLIDVDGEIHTGKDWSAILNIGVNRINTYVRQYGLENTIEFIRRFKANPNLKPKHMQSYYDLYMTNT